MNGSTGPDHARAPRRGTLDERWAVRKLHTRLLLHLMVLSGTGVALSAVSWASGGSAFYLALIAVVGLGHGFSAWWGDRSRGGVTVAVFVAAALLAWSMRMELLVVISGGSLFLMSQFLAAFQSIASFNLRGLRSLYDSLLLSLVVLLLVSEAALTPVYFVFLAAFGLIAVIFLATTNPVIESSRMHAWNSARMRSMMVAVPAMVVLTFAVSLGVFIVLPQTYLLRNAMPLPSRVDLTLGRPVAPAPLPASDTAPSSGFLPTAGADALLDGAGTLGFGEYATLGYTGERAEDVVMYVRSPLTSFWRGQVLEEYDGRGWRTIEGASQVELDPLGTLMFSDTPLYGTGGGRYVQTFFPQVRQPEAVFTGYAPGFIAVLNAPSVQRFSTSEYPDIDRLRAASSYSVTSSVPRLTPNQLIFDSADYSYLNQRQTPEVPQRVADLANAIVDGATSDFQMAARLEQYLLLNYRYDLRVPPMSPSTDVVDEFLFERQAGYCAHFATAMAVMARLVGLPARVAVGYIPGTFDSLTGAHTVRLQDAHAWVEISFIGHGWVPFDPSPRPDSPFALDVGFAGTTRSFQSVMRGQVGTLLRSLPVGVGGAVASLRAIGGPSMVALAIVAGALLLSGLWIVIRQFGRALSPGQEAYRYRLLDDTPRQEAVRAYRKASHVMRRRGYPMREAHQSPGEYVAKLDLEHFNVPNPFRTITRIATRALYDPGLLDPGIAGEVKGLLKALRAAQANVT